MKRKLILCGMISIGCSYAFIMSSQEDLTYWQKFKDYVAESSVGKWWAEGQKLDPEGRKRLQSVWKYGRKGGVAGLTLGGIGGVLYGLRGSDSLDVLFGTMMGGLGSLASIVIRDVWNDYNKGRISRAEVMTKMELAIEKTINNNCPTHNTKLVMLQDIDYFMIKLHKYSTSSYIESQLPLIEEVLKRIQARVKMQQADIDKDKKIDDEIKKIESMLTGDLVKDIRQLETAEFKAQKYVLFKLQKELRESSIAIAIT